MGFLKTGDTEMQIYLTEYGKNKMLEQQFVITSFTINDSDVNCFIKKKLGVLNQLAVKAVSSPITAAIV